MRGNFQRNFIAFAPTGLRELLLTSTVLLPSERFLQLSSVSPAAHWSTLQLLDCHYSV